MSYAATYHLIKPEIYNLHKIWYNIFDSKIQILEKARLDIMIKKLLKILAVIAVMSFLSIAVMFATLYADLRYSQAERDVQLLRERSIRLQEELHQKTTHQAVREELAKRGIDLRDPERTKTIVDN